MSKKEKITTVRVKLSTYKNVVKRAAEEGRPVSNFIRQTIEEKVDRVRKKTKLEDS